jgi:hypothetical protein
MSSLSPKQSDFIGNLVCLAGVEPTTFGSGGQRSVQLSYRHKIGELMGRYPFFFSNSFMNATSVSIPSAGKAL